MKHFVYALTIILLVTFLPWIAGGSEKKQTTTQDLPKVLLIGDSISMGYGKKVRQLLQGKAIVTRPGGNHRYSAHGVKHIGNWLGNQKWDVVHFNFGIWDTHFTHKGQLVRVENLAKYKKEDLKVRSTTEAYVQNLSKVIASIRRKNPGAKIIWASTTPCSYYGEDHAKLIVKNNEAAAKLMKKENITINDLHACALPNLKEWHSTDRCHFNPKGKEALAKKVAASIEEVLAVSRTTPNKQKSGG